MWEPCNAGLQPQLQLNGTVWCPKAIQEFSCIVKSWSPCMVVTASRWIHLSIHTKWMLSNTLIILYVLLGTIPGESTASTTAHGIVWCPAVTRAAVVAAWWWIFLPIHIIWIMSLTMVMFEIDVGTMPWVSAAWTTGQWYGKMTRIITGSQLHSQILIIKRCCKGNVMAPYVHPHHMNVVKQLLYVRCAFRNHSPGESTASTTAQWHGMMPSSDLGFQPTPPIQSVPTAAVVAAWWWIGLPSTSYECCQTPW